MSPWKPLHPLAAARLAPCLQRSSSITTAGDSLTLQCFIVLPRLFFSKDTHLSLSCKNTLDSQQFCSGPYVYYGSNCKYVHSPQRPVVGRFLPSPLRDACTTCLRVDVIGLELPSPRLKREAFDTSIAVYHIRFLLLRCSSRTAGKGQREALCLSMCPRHCPSRTETRCRGKLKVELFQETRARET